MVSCGARGQRNPDGFRFCGSCGSPLEDQATVGREVRKTITVVFCDLAGRRPLVVALEDLHWAEPTLLDLVEYLANFSASSPLLLGVARTELLDARPDWGGSAPAATTILLEPLTAAESDRLVGELLGTPG